MYLYQYFYVGSIALTWFSLYPFGSFWFRNFDFLLLCFGNCLRKWADVTWICRLRKQIIYSTLAHGLILVFQICFSLIARYWTTDLRTHRKLRIIVRRLRFWACLIQNRNSCHWSKFFWKVEYSLIAPLSTLYLWSFWISKFTNRWS